MRESVLSRSTVGGLRLLLGFGGSMDNRFYCSLIALLFDVFCVFMHGTCGGGASGQLRMQQAAD